MNESLDMSQNKEKADAKHRCKLLSKLSFSAQTISYEEAVKDKPVPEIILEALSNGEKIYAKSAEKDLNSGRMKVELLKNDYAFVIDPAKTEAFINEMVLNTQNRPADYWDECGKSKGMIPFENMERLKEMLNGKEDECK